METQDHQSQSLIELAVAGRQEEFISAFKELLAKFSDDDVDASVHTLEPEAETEDEDSDEESVINQIEAAAQYLSGSICDYQEGTLDVCVQTAAMAKEFANFLDNFLPVDDYDIYEVQELNCRCLKGDDEPHDHDIDVTVDSEAYTDWESVPDDSLSNFQFIIYLADDLIDGDDVIIDGDEGIPDPDEEFGEVYEVQKVVKINFKGKKVIRMKCQKGYKYDAKQHACVKREEHDMFLRRRKAQLNMLRRVASKAAIKKKINHKSLRFLLNRKRLGIGY